MQYKDQLNRIVNLRATPEKIVSLVPSQTELLFDLGLEKEVVGITKFCVHPADWKKNKVILGGTKKLNIEKIILLRLLVHNYSILFVCKSTKLHLEFFN